MGAECRTHANRQIVIRCSGASFSVARKMHKGAGQNSQIATLVPCKNQRAEMEKLGLPTHIERGT